jgi:hypothetical protein
MHSLPARRRRHLLPGGSVTCILSAPQPPPPQGLLLGSRPPVWKSACRGWGFPRAVPWGVRFGENGARVFVTGGHRPLRASSRRPSRHGAPTCARKGLQGSAAIRRQNFRRGAPPRLTTESGSRPCQTFGCKHIRNRFDPTGSTRVKLVPRPSDDVRRWAPPIARSLRSTPQARANGTVTGDRQSVEGYTNV